jgi:hypothetical protein
MGTAFFTEASGGPLAIDARGRALHVGGGIGAANIYIRKASSVQIDPLEPGLNH